MRLPAPKLAYYDTISIEFKDGCVINLPYFDKESMEYYLQKLWDSVSSFKIIPYSGSCPTKDIFPLDRAA